MKTINELHFKHIKAHSDMKLGKNLQSLWFEIPGYCHLNCAYCFAKEKTKKATSKSLSISDYENILFEFAALGGKFLGIPGKGEPFHEKNWDLFKRIVEKADSLGIETTIFTSGDAIFFSGTDDTPDYRKIEFLKDKKIVFLIKVNSLRADVQDQLVEKIGYTAQRSRAMEILINEYDYNTKGKLGIVTSIMKENKEEIIKLYDYARSNNLIFDCDTILQRGKGIDFFEKDDITYTEIREVFEDLVRVGAIKERPTGTYVGVACDRLDHHLYIDINGNAYPCIGCTDTLKEDLLLGNIFNDNLESLWNNQFRNALRDRQDEIFEGVCSKCINFIKEDCFSCLGRSVKSFEFYGQSKNKIIINTHGCINHVPDFQEWVVAVDEYLRIVLSDPGIKQSFIEDWESLWMPNQNFAFTLLQLDEPAREKLIERLKKKNIDPHDPDGFNINKIDEIKKLPVSKFSLKKQFSYSELDFPLNKIWDFIYDPRKFFDFSSSDNHHLIKALKKSILSNVFIPSMKYYLFEHGKKNEIILCNLIFYDNSREKYFYRTFSDGDLDIVNNDDETNRYNKSVILFRLAENFGTGSYLSKYIFDLSDQFRHDIYSDYELVLTPDDDHSLASQSVLLQRSNFTINISDLLNINIVKTKIDQIDSFLNRKFQDPTFNIQDFNKYIFKSSSDKVRISLESFFQEFSDLSFYDPVEFQEQLDPEREKIKKGLVEVVKKTYIIEKNNPLPEGHFCPIAFAGSLKEETNLPLKKFASLFEDINKMGYSQTLNKLINYLIFLSYLYKYLDIKYYFIYHSTNFAYKKDAGYKPAPPSGMLVCSKKRLSKDAKTKTRLLISSLLQPFDEQYNIAQLVRKDEDIKKHASKAAIAQVMARNMSHNIGSHVLSRLTTSKSISNSFGKVLDEDGVVSAFIKILELNNYDAGKSVNDFKQSISGPETVHQYESLKIEGNDKQRPVDALATFNSYLKTRMDFLADSTTSIPTLESTKYLLKDVLSEFDRNRILLDRISGISEFKYKVIPRNLVKLSEKEYDTGFTDENEQVYNECIITEYNNNDILVSIPNDVLGYHALYVILENFIRNSAKHGKNHDLNVYIDIKDSDGFYELFIFDNIEITGKVNIPVESDEDRNKYKPFIERGKKEIDRIEKLVFDQNHTIKQAVLDDTGKLRPGGWGLIEMSASAAYLRKIAAEMIDHKDYEITNEPFSNENNDIKNTESGKFTILKAVARNGKYLGYRLFLMKPKEVLVIDELGALNNIPSRERNELINSGVLICSKDEYDADKIYPHKFLAYFGEDIERLYSENPGGLSRRAIKYTDALNARLLRDFNNVPELNKNLWKLYLQQMGVRYGEYCYESINLVLPEGKENGPLNKKKTYFSNHGSDFMSQYKSKEYGFIEIDTSLTKIYKPKESSIYSRDNQDEILATKLAFAESMWIRIMVLDERIQEFADGSTYSPEKTGNFHSDPIPFRKIYESTNILVPQKEECNLNLQSFDKEINKIINYFSNRIWDYCIIHLGILEKMIDAHNLKTEITKSFSKESSGITDFIDTELLHHIKEADIKASLIDRIIITSGRGKPHNLPENLRYLNFSIVSQYMIENRYKYLITQAVTSARRITEISGL